VLSTVASLGGSIEEAVIEDGDYTMKFWLAPGTDIRQVTDVLKATYPSAQILRHRRITRTSEPAERVERALETDLTDRQRIALEAAYHTGLFQWPRDATGELVQIYLDGYIRLS